MKNSSGLCPWSADHPLSPLRSSLWYAINWLDNHWFPNRGEVEECYFAPAVIQEEWQLLDRLTSPCNSPSRRMIHLFLQKLPWQALAAEMGALHLVDIGCGRGRAGLQLQHLSGGRIDGYHGFDLHPWPEWSSLAANHPFMTFSPLAADQVARHLPPSTNFIFTQTSLEHIAADLELFQQIQHHFTHCGQTALHLHFIPSPACLALYQLHGYRQYSKRKIARLARLHEETHRAILFSLGGEACYHFHFTYRPLASRLAAMSGEEQLDYSRKLFQIVQTDVQTPSRPASFYALLLVPPRLFPLFDSLSLSRP